MFEPDFQRRILALVMGFIVHNADVPPEITEVSVKGLEVSTISVSCLKVEWESEPDRDYTVTCEAVSPDYAYYDNMYFEFKSDSLCYITGLREDTEYTVTVEPVILSEEENTEAVPVSENGKTETVEVIWDFPHEDGWTNCFAGERASGLKAQPASGAIYGSVVDPITNTGIRRDEYGDYCAALGLFYGYDWDRYLVELENGTQFTVKQCDSKGWADDGEGKYHNFGGDGKCIVEFIYDDNSLPSCVAFSGSWGYYNWCGLDLGANIKSIKKINYGDPVVMRT